MTTVTTVMIDEERRIPFSPCFLLSVLLHGIVLLAPAVSRVSVPLPAERLIEVNLLHLPSATQKSTAKQPASLVPRHRVRETLLPKPLPLLLPQRSLFLNSNSVPKPITLPVQSPKQPPKQPAPFTPPAPSTPTPAPTVPEPDEPLSPKPEPSEIAPLIEIEEDTEELGEDVLVSYAGGITITKDDFRQHLRKRWLTDVEHFMGTPEDKLQIAMFFLQNMVLQDLKVREAERRGIGNRPAVQYTIRHLMEDESIVDLVDSITAKKMQISPEEVSRYYEEHKDQFEGRPLEQVSSYIESLLQRREAARRLEEFIEQLKASASIERHEELLAQHNPPDDAVLFSVNGVPFTMRQFREELERLPQQLRQEYSKPEKQRELLEGLILRLLLIEAADKVTDETLRERLHRVREAILTAILHQEEVDGNVHVSEADIKAAYEASKQHYITPERAKIAFISLPVGRRVEEKIAFQHKVEALKEEIAQSQDFLSIMRKEDGKESVIGQEVRKWWYRGVEHWGDLLGEGCKFCETVFSLKPGEVSEPFMFAGRWWILYMKEKQEKRTASLEETRPFIAYRLWSQRHDAEERKLNQNLWEAAKPNFNMKALKSLFEASDKPASDKPASDKPKEPDANKEEEKGKQDATNQQPKKKSVDMSDKNG